MIRAVLEKLQAVLSAALAQPRNRAPRCTTRRMDPLDAFYQQLDSEDLLKQHHEGLVKDAREILAKSPDARGAGVITFPDSSEARPLRDAMAKAAGRDLAETRDSRRSDHRADARLHTALDTDVSPTTRSVVLAHTRRLLRTPASVIVRGRLSHR